MSHETHIQPYHRHVGIVMIVGCLAIGFLLLSVWSLQRSHGLNGALSGPQVSPTPISSGSISVATPHLNDHVPQTFIVTGDTTGSQVGIRLRDKYSGQIITEVRAMSNAKQPGQNGKFGAELQITNDAIRSEAPLVLDVFEPAAGNQELSKITIPLTFTPVGE